MTFRWFAGENGQIFYCAFSGQLFCDDCSNSDDYNKELQSKELVDPNEDLKQGWLAESLTPKLFNPFNSSLENCHFDNLE